MATYDYRCTKCGKEFSRIERISEHGRRKPTCPKCGSKSTERVLTAFFAKTARKS